jgi:hypothetical protein
MPPTLMPHASLRHRLAPAQHARASGRYTRNSVKWPQVALSARQVACTEYVETSVQPKRSIAMKKRVVMAMIASMAFAVTAWGAEMEYSGTFCGIQKRNVLYSTSDLTVLSLESWGIQPSESTFEPWKNASVHCVGYTRTTQGDRSHGRYIHRGVPGSAG